MSSTGRGPNKPSKSWDDTELSSAEMPLSGGLWFLCVRDLLPGSVNSKVKLVVSLVCDARRTKHRIHDFICAGPQNFEIICQPHVIKGTSRPLVVRGQAAYGHEELERDSSGRS